MIPEPLPPTVCVVVGCFNHAAFLADALASVQGQSSAAWECVVVDDGSTDSSGEIAAEFAASDARFRVITQPNAGVSVARNAGIRAVSPSVAWLLFLDADDVLLPTAVENLLDAAASRPDAVAHYGLAEYIDETGAPIRSGAHPQVQRDRRRPSRIDLENVPAGEDSTFDSLAVSGTIWPPAVALLRRAEVERAGAFDPEQALVEDWDLWLRLSRYGPLVPLDRQVVWYRQHPTNISRQDPSDMAFYYERVKWKAWTSAENTRAHRKAVGHIWRRLRSRWVLWSLLALVSKVRRGQLSAARRAGRAVAVFGRDVVRGHPREPDRRTAALIAEFIATHQAGRGFDSPENWHVNLSCSGGDPAGNGRRPESRSAARRR